MAESTSVHPTGVALVGHHVLYRTPEAELLKPWQRARDTLDSSEMFEASAYLELLSAARNIETDPDRLYRAVEHHTALAARISADRAAEDHLRSRTRTALLRRVGQVYLHLDAEAAFAEADAYDMQITRTIADRLAVEGR